LITGHIDYKALAAAPALGSGEEHPIADEVQRFLERYGYLPPGEARAGLIDPATSQALTAYQRFHSLPETGNFEAAVRDMMLLPRCGIQDLKNGIAFSVAWAQDHLDLTFAFGRGTLDLPFQYPSSPVPPEMTGPYVEFDMVKNALRTLAETGHFAFREVTADDDPDILFEWVATDDPDSLPRGTLGTAYYPRDARPQAVRFNDFYNWSWANFGGHLFLYAVDVETVALHELGHVIGLSHSDVFGSVMQPHLDPSNERRKLHHDDLAAIRMLYGMRPNDLASAIIFQVRQHFGDEQSALPGAWVGASAEYEFELPGIDVNQPAYLMFQALGVTSEHDVFTLNKQPIAGGIPLMSGNEGWAAQVMLVSPRVLLPGKNILRVEARDASGGTGGDLDDFVLDNAVLLYSTITPGLFPLPPSKWGPAGIPGSIGEAVDLFDQE
jgi:hypothetical protein